MNKSEFIDEVHANLTKDDDTLVQSKVDTEIIINVVLDTMKQAIYTNGELNLRGFGTFSVRNKPARKARNPKTGEIIDVPARKKLAFKISPVIIEKLNS